MATLALTAAPAPTTAQPIPQGPPFRVNTYTPGRQGHASIADLFGATFVASWQSWGQDGSQYGIFAQRWFGFGGPGGAQGPEFRVNSYTTSNQTNPAAAGPGTLLPFVIVWESDGQDGDAEGIFGQRFSTDGVPLGGEFRVNSFTGGPQTRPAVATVKGTGDFVVVWSSTGQDGSAEGVFAQRYLGGGFPLGPEFRVNTTTMGPQRAPSVVGNGAGGFLVVWEGYSPGVQGFDIYGQRYANDGVPAGGEFRVNAYTTGLQRFPSVGGGGADFMIAWQSATQDGSGYGVYAQRCAPAGGPVGPEFRVNTTTALDQTAPSVAPPSGNMIVVSWQSDQGPAGGRDVFLQKFSSGTPVGGQWRVNTFTARPQTDPSVLYDWGSVVSWTSPEDPDGSTGIYVQVYNDLPVELQTFVVE